MHCKTRTNKSCYFWYNGIAPIKVVRYLCLLQAEQFRDSLTVTDRLSVTCFRIVFKMMAPTLSIGPEIFILRGVAACNVT
jgi:hypothetical protein